MYLKNCNFVDEFREPLASGHYVVQKNLRYRISNDASFDLKGVGAKRRMETPSVVAVSDEESPRPQRPGQTLWDQNFREWTQGKPLCLAKADLSYLEAAMFFWLHWSLMIFHYFSWFLMIFGLVANSCFAGIL